MSMADLITELRSAAEDEAEKIIEAARREAEAIDQQAAREVSDRRARFLTEKERAIRKEARSVLATARRTAMRDVLSARTKLVDRVFEKAKQLLPSVSKSESYMATVVSDLHAALRFVENNAVVRCPAALVPVALKAVQNRENVTVEEDAEISTGFVVTGERGSMTIDDRLETRLQRTAPALAIDILARLKET